MALFSFTKKIIQGNPIEVFNNGEMFRSFTYIEDIVEEILEEKVVKKEEEVKEEVKEETKAEPTPEKEKLNEDTQEQEGGSMVPPSETENVFMKIVTNDNEEPSPDDKGENSIIKFKAIFTK